MDAEPTPQPSVAPAPRLLIQILEVGGLVQAHTAPGISTPDAVEILIKVLPFMWDKAKAEAQAATQVVKPTVGMVQALKNRLRVNHGKV